MTDFSNSRPRFRALTEANASDWHNIIERIKPMAENIAGRVLSHLQLLDDFSDGFPISRLNHCLQAATRAHRDGRDEEYVVMALLHDIGDTLGTYNHPDIAAAILKPFLSEDNYWIVQQHGIFQGYYYFHHLKLDRNLREQFRGHPCFEATAEFSEKFDQMAFDSEYDSAPLTFFEPMVQRVMARPRRALIM